MKKIIYIVGILFLAIVAILNILYTGNMNSNEQLSIDNNGIKYIICLVVEGLVIFGITKVVNDHLYEDTEKKNKARKVILVLALIVYISFSAIWLLKVRPGVGADQIHVCNLAQTFFRGDPNEFLPNLTYAGIPLSQYIQSYQQQITLAFVFNIFFQIIRVDAIELLRILNLLGNLLTIFALYKIGKQLSKKYRTNNVLLFTLILTFISLPMLATFIYGDIPAMGLCLMAVYFTMRYTETKHWKYIIGASIFTMIAYMMRMNCLIFIIATVMYLLMSLWKEIKETTWKQNLLKIAVIGIYIGIAIVPSSIIKSYYLNKFDLDKSKVYPSISYFYMAMMESPRANGWYVEAIGEYALKNPEAAKEEYKDKIKDRVTYFAQNPKYAYEFYRDKITSMWGENTYSAVTNNITKRNDPIENMREPLLFYQKALMIIMAVCSLVVLIQNRKNLSLELLFLITIFIGGFAFHILWEAKSRYIIPYVVVLIPVASIYIQKIGLKEKLDKYIKTRTEKNAKSE